MSENDKDLTDGMGDEDYNSEDINNGQTSANDSDLGGHISFMGLGSNDSGANDSGGVGNAANLALAAAAAAASSAGIGPNSTATYHGSRSASHIGRKPAFGQTCSMKTLLQDGILQVGEKVLTLEYEGEKFCGDLCKDGTIRMRGPDDSPHIYATPVAWANHCCKMLNPESKPLNAWSSIRFKGKRLDSYKLKWYRAQKKTPNLINNNNINNSLNNNINNDSARVVSNIIGSMDLQNNTVGGIPLDSNIIRTLTQGLTQHQSNNHHNHHNQQHQNQAGNNSRLMLHNPITHYFPQYENPIKNKKLIKSVLISNNMDNDCKRLVAKSLDLSADPCVMSQQMNQENEILMANNNTNNNNDNNNNGDINNDENQSTNEDAKADDSIENNHQPEDETPITSDNNKIVIKKENNITTNNKNNQYCTTLKTTVINYEQLGTRGPHNTHNPNTMVKCIPFSAVDRIQPFNVTVSTNALLLVDFHSHLVPGEVTGYLAGSWDPGQHVLTVTQAFPCKTDISCESTASNVEEEIRQDIEKRNLTLVGWYHSHQGKYSNHPTIKDIKNQMEHQITMKESSSGYSPCIGLICCPHDIRTKDDCSPSFQIYWIMPPPESMANHYGRPMQMYYSVTRDLFLTQDLLLEMRLLATYYTQKSTDMVDFKSLYEHNDRITNLDKLSNSIKPKLPKDLQESEYPDEPAIWKAAVDHFWKFLRNLVIPQNEVAGQEQQEDSHNQEQEYQQQQEDGIEEDEEIDEQLQQQQQHQDDEEEDEAIPDEVDKELVEQEEQDPQQQQID